MKLFEQTRQLFQWIRSIFLCASYNRWVTFPLGETKMSGHYQAIWDNNPKSIKNFLALFIKWQYTSFISFQGIVLEPTIITWRYIIISGMTTFILRGLIVCTKCRVNVFGKYQF